jgi:hypothetical protein
VRLAVQVVEIMAEINRIEKWFVDEFIVSTKRERYLSFLKGRKHRQKILERLNHSLDYNERKASRLDPSYRNSDRLVAMLKGLYVGDTCRLLADGNTFDGRELRLDRAVPELLDNYFGALILCPPVAVYKPEGTGDLILLSNA